MGSASFIQLEIRGYVYLKSCRGGFVAQRYLLNADIPISNITTGNH